MKSTRGRALLDIRHSRHRHQERLSIRVVEQAVRASALLRSRHPDTERGLSDADRKTASAHRLSTIATREPQQSRGPEPAAAVSRCEGSVMGIWKLLVAFRRLDGGTVCGRAGFTGRKPGYESHQTWWVVSSA